MLRAEMPRIEVDRLLAVMRDFDESGGASLGLVAWELCVPEADVQPGWDEATSGGLLEAAAHIPGEREPLWRLSRAGWARLGVDPADERRRLEAIERLRLLARAADPGLARLVRLASYVGGGSAAGVHILDRRYQHRIAAEGAELGTHPAYDSMCRVTVDHKQAVFCVDATTDRRFEGSTFMDSAEPVRFYASVPLRTLDEDVVIGTLCTWDSRPQELPGDRQELLADLAEQVVTLLEVSRVTSELGARVTHDSLTRAVRPL